MSRAPDSSPPNMGEEGVSEGVGEKMLKKIKKDPAVVIGQYN